MRTTISNLCLYTLCTGVLIFSGCVHAQENHSLIGDIQTIARTEGYLPAIRKIDKELPNNEAIKTELLMLKAGLKLNNQQSKDAINIYIKLVKEQPKNLVARNNLASIYASQGKLVEAERLILTGIKLHPEFATLYSSLMTIKSQRAASALQLALDPNQPRSARTLLAAIHSFNGNNIQAPVYEPTTNQSSTPSKPGLIANPSDKSTAPPSPEVSTVNQPAVELAKTPTPSVEDEQLLAFAQNWAQAWSSGDAERYLSYYSEAFIPESKSSFTVWANQRRQRITPNQGIQVQIEEVQVLTRTHENAEIRFRQWYQSKTLKARSNKSLTLTWQNDQWKIVRERIVTR
jgi:tetratricopeptide (TPR) repeat protein